MLTKETLTAMQAELDESTKVSWLWCFLFGPFWFAFIGSWKWFAISMLAALATLGLSILVMPFFAYKAHRDLAMAKAIRLA